MSQDAKQNIAVGIIVVAHTDYASALLRTAEFILGSLGDCTSISVDVAFAVSETVQRLNDAAQLLDKGAGVLILTDMFGGTPSNLAISCMSRPKVEVLAGINLPMLVKLAKVREERSLPDAIAMAQEAGRKYVPIASRVLAGK